MRDSVNNKLTKEASTFLYISLDTIVIISYKLILSIIVSFIIFVLIF